jgi:hypothetical protein
MSLDVYLTIDAITLTRQAPGKAFVYTREDGRIVRKEVERKDEAVELPAELFATEDEWQEVYWGNITHNLNRMARAAKLYDCMWRPDENGMETAEDLIGPLTEGLAKLKGDPESFKQFNPENGWGTYEGLVKFVEEYLAACEGHPEATVRASR